MTQSTMETQNLLIQDAHFGEGKTTTVKADFGPESACVCGCPVRDCQDCKDKVSVDMDAMWDSAGLSMPMP